LERLFGEIKKYKIKKPVIGLVFNTRLKQKNVSK
jgi:hypothetical protein